MYVCACSVAQSCPALCDPMDCSQPASFVDGIFQIKIPEWVAISSSRGSFWPRAWTHISCVSCIGREIVYHWATWEAQFQVYCFVIWYLHTLCEYHHNKSSIHLLPYKVIPILLTIFLMLYCIPVACSVIGALHLLIPFIYFGPCSAPLPPATTHLVSIRRSLVLFVLVFRSCTYVRSSGICLSLSESLHLA